MLQQATEMIVQLYNFIMTELRIILGKQRQDCCILEIYQPQCPVENQATNSDGSPVTDIIMEQFCCLVGYHPKNWNSLSVSVEAWFSMKKLHAQEKDLKLTLAQKMKEKFAEVLLGEQNGCESSITIEQFWASLKWLL